MPRPVKIAAVQMDAAPAPLDARLARAQAFVRGCAERGARLVVLPEVFNTGYEYSGQNYRRAESSDGPTAGWMKRTAARYRLHLAGSFLRRQDRAIFNTLLLAAPDGRTWSYDKNYPWMWERAYFQNGTGTVVADTDLGKIGFLICWDVAHPELWRNYSGQVQLMIVSSCPPRAFDLALVFPDGSRILGADSGALTRRLKRASDGTFGDYLRRQAAHLGVPVAHATGTGTFRSPLPNPASTLAMLSVFYPPLWKYRSRFDQVRMETGYFNETCIADDTGAVLQSVPPGTEGFAMCDVRLPDAPPPPKGKQPRFGLPAFVYLFDALANRLMASEYRKRTRAGAFTQVRP